MAKETYNYKRFAIKAAKELYYPDAVIAKLKEAQTESEISRIMRNARLAQEV